MNLMPCPDVAPESPSPFGAALPPPLLFHPRILLPSCFLPIGLPRVSHRIASLASLSVVTPANSLEGIRSKVMSFELDQRMGLAEARADIAQAAAINMELKNALECADE